MLLLFYIIYSLRTRKNDNKCYSLRLTCECKSVKVCKLFVCVRSSISKSPCFILHRYSSVLFHIVFTITWWYEMGGNVCFFLSLYLFLSLFLIFFLFPSKCVLHFESFFCLVLLSNHIRLVVCLWWNACSHRNNGFHSEMVYCRSVMHAVHTKKIMLF